MLKKTINIFLIKVPVFNPACIFSVIALSIFFTFIPVKRSNACGRHHLTGTYHQFLPGVDSIAPDNVTGKLKQESLPYLRIPAETVKAAGIDSVIWLFATDLYSKNSITVQELYKGKPGKLSFKYDAKEELLVLQSASAVTSVLITDENGNAVLHKKDMPAQGTISVALLQPGFYSVLVAGNGSNTKQYFFTKK